MQRRGATMAPGKRSATHDLVQLRSVATQGLTGGGTTLPHLEPIQRAFGADHDVSSIRAHVGGPAAVAADAIGAEAYATGGDVAFRSAPDLHTAAHEAAHVIQQHHGVQLYGGVGEAGDAYERHADAVADRVVAGMSATDLLDAPTGGLPVAAVQCKTKGEAKADAASGRAATATAHMIAKRLDAQTASAADERTMPDSDETPSADYMAGDTLIGVFGEATSYLEMVESIATAGDLKHTEGLEELNAAIARSRAIVESLADADVTLWFNNMRTANDAARKAAGLGSSANPKDPKSKQDGQSLRSLEIEALQDNIDAIAKNVKVIEGNLATGDAADLEQRFELVYEHLAATAGVIDTVYHSEPKPVAKKLLKEVKHAIAEVDAALDAVASKRPELAGSTYIAKLKEDTLQTNLGWQVKALQRRR